MIRVGYINAGYAEIRNIIHKVDGCDYIYVNNLYKILNLPIRFFRKIGLTHHILLDYAVNNEFQFSKFDFKKVDIFHLFNSVGYGSLPWISTFETILPRFSSLLTYHHVNGKFYIDSEVKKALETICSPSCKKIIAMSECNKNIQVDFLEKYTNVLNDIEPKINVLHPPQQLIIHKMEERELEYHNNIKFLFVGNDFFRKGGREILNTFQMIRKEFNVNLTIISSIKYSDYSTRSTYQDYINASNIIRDNSEWITYMKPIPNKLVLELCKKHHVGLLPTWADTYGYSVLEMQATGCPVITTNVRALTEINNNDCGWIIDVPINRHREAMDDTPEMRTIMKHSIEKQLYEKVLYICEHSDNILEKGELSLRRIKAKHSPVEYSNQLGKIYNQALH